VVWFRGMVGLCFLMVVVVGSRGLGYGWMAMVGWFSGMDLWG